MSSSATPDPSSPGAVAGVSFPVARKGFEPTAVRDFLRRVSHELGRVQHERDHLAAELDALREASRRRPPEELDEATVAAKLGEEAARVLATAHEAAAQIRARAEESSSRTLRDAELDAARLRGDAEVEAARRRQEAHDEAEAEVESAKLEGREMIAEARAVRERIFSDLTRRRDLARQQIEGLQSGRVAIINAFRRARTELDAILGELEAQVPSDEEEAFPPLDLPETAAVPATPQSSVVVGEMDLPAAIVERHVGQEPTAPPERVDVDEEAVDVDEPETVTEPDEVDEANEAEVPDEPHGPDDAVVAVAVEELVLVEELVDERAPDDTTAEVPAVAAEPAPTPKGPVASHPSVDDLFARLRASSSEAIAREVLQPKGGGVATAESRESVGAAALERREAALGTVRTALARQLKRVLADEQNDVLDRLRQRHASLAVDDVLGAAKLHPGTYRETAEDHLWAAALAGARSLSDLEGEELDAALEARSVLDRSLDTLESELVVPLRARLTENLDAAGDAVEASTLLRATYRDWKGRIDELAADLVRTAFGRAAYAVLTPGTPVCWVLDPAGPGCPDAEDNVLAGAVPAGEPFPTGHRYAPAYRGCRCLLVTVPG